MMLRRRMMLAQGGVSLPAGYTKIEYLESDGSQFIDTGYKPNNNTRVIFEGYNNSTSSGWIFGAWKAANSQMFCASALKTYNICYGTDIWANATMPVGPISIDINKNTYTYNGVSGTLSEQTFSCDYTMYLFHINAAGTVSTGSFNGRIYSVKIYDNGTLVRDFIPAMNASGEAGLYDLKNDVWYALLPVVKPKVENKIKLIGEADLLGNIVISAESEFAVRSLITVTLRIRYTAELNGNLRPVNFTTDLTIYNNMYSSDNVSTIPFNAMYPTSSIESISPTEDDTYIYTF